MIVCIGEILADMIEIEAGEEKTFRACCGGAPFNVAVNAKRAGANVGFVGRVGDDPIGRFLIRQAQKACLDDLQIQTDEKRDTTLTFVALKNGERDFAFHRHDTADYHIDIKNVFWSGSDLTIVHLGSLMLSEKSGQDLAREVVKKTKSLGKKLSFDINFRKDLYADFQNAVKAYQPFVKEADIVKFSEDEILEYTGETEMEKAIASVYRTGQLLLITLGAKGCIYRFNECLGYVSSETITPIDTTGAGDAFFGTFLAKIEKSEWTKENIESALQAANRAGAETTQFFGAIRL